MKNETVEEPVSVSEMSQTVETVETEEQKKSGRKINPGRWRAGEYVRQLSIVIIGILITFKGTDMINDAFKLRDLNNTLAMVREELAVNAATVDYIINYISFEKDGMTFFSENMRSLKDVPSDSVSKYLPVIGLSTTFSFTTDAMEVLKSSGTIQNIRNRDLLRRLFATYGALQTLADNANAYYLEKRKVVTEFLYNVDDRITDELYGKGNPYPFMGKYVVSNATRNFMRNAPGNMQVAIQEANMTRAAVERSIEHIDREIE